MLVTKLLWRSLFYCHHRISGANKTRNPFVDTSHGARCINTAREPMEVLPVTLLTVIYLIHPNTQVPINEI